MVKENKSWFKEYPILSVIGGLGALAIILLFISSLVGKNQTQPAYDNNTSYIPTEVRQDSNLITPTKTQPDTVEEQKTISLEILQLDCTYDGYSEILKHQASFIGRVKNNGNTLAKFVQVHVDFFDKGGKLVGTEFAYASGTDIPPDGIDSFKGHAIELLSNFEKCVGHVIASPIS